MQPEIIKKEGKYKSPITELKSGLKVIDPSTLTPEQKKRLRSVNVNILRKLMDVRGFLGLAGDANFRGDAYVTIRMNALKRDYHPLSGPEIQTVIFRDAHLMRYLLDESTGVTAHRKSIPLDKIRRHIKINAVTNRRLPELPHSNPDSLSSHTAFRKDFSPEFTPKGSAEHQKLYTEIVTKHIEKAFALLKEKFEVAQELGTVAEIDVSKLTALYTLGAVFEALFGFDDIEATIQRMEKDLTGQAKESFKSFDELKSYIRLANHWVSEINNMGSEVLASIKFPKLKKQYEAGTEKLANYTTWMLDNAQSTHVDGAPTMISQLKKFHPIDTNDEALNDTNRAIREGAIPGLTIVGFETTALLLQRFLFQLRTRPDLLENLAQAVEEGNANYLENVFFELSRLHPGIPRLPRVLNDDLVIQDGDELLKFPKDTMMTFLIYVANRDPRFWGDDYNLDEFHPERWNKYRKDGTKNLVFPEHFLTFGGGNTQCTGPQFALLEFKKFVEQLVAHKDIFTLHAKGSDEIHFEWVIAEHVNERIMADLVDQKKEK